VVLYKTESISQLQLKGFPQSSRLACRPFVRREGRLIKFGRINPKFGWSYHYSGYW
jgi:hypothetical protein